MDKATKRPLYLPWETDGQEITCSASLDILHHVGIISEEEYAHLIVKAVNCHEELVGALNQSEELLKIISDDLCQCEELRQCKYHRVYNEVKQALNALGEKG